MTNFYGIKIIITMNEQTCSGRMNVYHTWSDEEGGQFKVLRQEDLSAAEAMRRVIKLRRSNGGKRRIDEEEDMILFDGTTWNEYSWTWEHEYSDLELRKME